MAFVVHSSGRTYGKEHDSCPPPIRILLLTAVSALVAAAQTETPAFVVHQCVKALPGKITELGSFLQNVSAKRARVRVDEGKAAWSHRESRCSGRR